MIVKVLFLFFLILFNIGCKQKINILDENNYVLIGTDSFHHIIADKVFVNKYDTSRRLIMIYSGDGTLTTKEFFKGVLFDGLSEHFYINGNILCLLFYQNGKKEGMQKWFYPNGKLKKIENYHNSTLISIENFDSTGVEIK